jgi:hypothetical protein
MRVIRSFSRALIMAAFLPEFSPQRSKRGIP